MIALKIEIKNMEYELTMHEALNLYEELRGIFGSKLDFSCPTMFWDRPQIDTTKTTGINESPEVNQLFISLRKRLTRKVYMSIDDKEYTIVNMFIEADLRRKFNRLIEQGIIKEYRFWQRSDNQLSVKIDCVDKRGRDYMFDFFDKESEYINSSLWAYVW